MVGKDSVDVALKFTASIAHQILRKKWHYTQREERLTSGDVILHFKLSSTQEIKRWANSWLPHCQILAPAELRDQVKRELERSLKFYP